MGLGLLKKVEERVNRVEEKRKQQHKEHEHAVLLGRAKPTTTERLHNSVTRVKERLPERTQERLEHTQETLGEGWNLFRNEAPTTARQMGGLFTAEAPRMIGLINQFNRGTAGSHTKTKKGKTKYQPGSIEKTSELFFAQPLNVRRRKHDSPWEL
jgi:hypothetical protein